MNTEIYRTAVKPIQGFNPISVSKRAHGIFKSIISKTKRRPYIRSSYFDKEKIFLDHFWQHLHSKNWRDRTRRLRQYPCALDLTRNSHATPISQRNPNRKSEMLHRFVGINGNGEKFYVQIKENTNTNEKHLMSIFPE